MRGKLRTVKNAVVHVVLLAVIFLAAVVTAVVSCWGVVSAGAASVWASPLLNLSVNQLMSMPEQPESVNSSRVSARRTQRVRRMALTPFS